VYPSQGRFWLAIVGVVLACCPGCNQPSQKTALGNLPGQPANDLEPKVNATTYFAHGHLLERQGQFERAAVQYRKAVALQPNFVSARNRLGITLNKLGRHAEASVQFRQAVAHHPELAYLRNNLGFSLYLEERYAEAEAALEQALSLKPDFPRAHLNRALVFARLNRFDNAFSELMQAGSEADARFNMGILLTEAQRYADAARYLESALALRPNFDAARQQLRDVSRLAAEAEAQQAAQPALAAETTIEKMTPERTETLVADTVTEDVTAEPAAVAVADTAAEETTVEPTETAVAHAGTEDVVSTTTMAAAEDAENETASPNLVEATVADVNAEVGAAEEAETAVEDAIVEPATATDAVIEDTVLEAAPTLAADVVIPVEGSPAETSPSLTAATESEPSQWGHEPGIDTELLFALIDEALTALKNQSPDFEMLWCRVSYYLFPETAPDEPTASPEVAPDDPGVFPENMPEEWILDWPY